MKKSNSIFLSFAIILMSALLSLASCKENVLKEDKFDDYSIEEQVIVDENGIKITVLSAANDEYGNPGLKLRAENTNPQKAGINIYGEGFNGVSYTTTFSTVEQGKGSFYADLKSGEYFEDIITFDKQTINEVGIESIKTFELSIQASFLGEYDEIGGGYEYLGDVFDVKKASVHTSLFDEKEQILNVNGIVLYDENGVKFTVKKGNNKTIHEVDDIIFVLENVSNEKNVSASVTSFEIINSDNKWVRLLTNDAELNEFGMNGIEPVEMLGASVFESSGIAAGSTAISPALWIEDTIIDNGFSEINTLRFSFALSFSDPQSKESAISPEYPSLDSTSYTIPYGVYTQTVEIDFSKQSAKTLSKYDPLNIPSKQYTIDNGNGEIGETVIFEELDLKITVLSLTPDKQGISLKIENYSKETLSIFFADTVSNGIDIDNEYWMYVNGLNSMWGLENLNSIAPGSFIETKYSPSFNLAQSNDSENNLYLLLPEYVIDELHTLSFRIVIEDASSQSALTPYDFNIRAEKNITLHINDFNCDGITHDVGADGYCIVCGVPVQATEGIEYSVSSDGTYAEVTRYTGNASRVIIADTYEGLHVTHIANNAFYGKTNITSIVIPDSISYIGASAFDCCYSLTDVNFGEASQLVEIDDNAFSSCIELSDITLPDSLSVIGDNTFESCLALSNVHLPDNITYIGTNAFGNCSNLIEIEEGVSYVGKYAVDYEGTNDSVTVRGGTILIAACTFSHIDTLYSVLLPDSLKYIGEQSFGMCDNLASITIPDNVISIGDRAFHSCKSMAEIKFGKESNLDSIGHNAFYGCEGLAEFTIPNKVTTLGNTVFFNCENLKNITIPSSIVNYGQMPFFSIIPETVTAPFSALYHIDTYNIKHLTVTGEDKIPHNAFSYWKQLESVTIANSVTEIGESAFIQCENLSTVRFQDYSLLSSIGNSAFRYCYNLTSVDFGNNSHLSTIGQIAFAQCERLANVNFGENSVLVNIGQKAFLDCTNLADIAIPDSVTTIGDMAFRSCTNLSEIKIGKNSMLSQISKDAFNRCNFIEFTIPDKVSSIENQAFIGCSNLVTIIIPQSVTNISANAFDLCANLSTVYYTGTEEQWNQIMIDSTCNEKLINANIIYNYVIE